MLGYLLSDDLMFISRIAGTAKDLGLEVRSARSQDQLANLLAAERPACLLLDLQNAGLEVSQLISGLAAPRPFVVGYGSHVDNATLNAARAAGCDLVLPRSKFVADLANSLPSWFDPLKSRT